MYTWKFATVNPYEGIKQIQKYIETSNSKKKHALKIIIHFEIKYWKHIEPSLNA